jgi:endonuclease YncB( thermonuclease family)
VIRIIDGDTFEARVRVWPGLNVDTKVRLRNVDAPELHARCADELAKAQAARAALETMLAAGGGDDFAGGDRQIWRPGRCRGLDARHR